MSILQAAFLAWAGMAVVMTVLWVVQSKTQNAGIVDVAWTFGTGASAVLFALVANGDPTRRLLVAVLGSLWALRLGLGLVKRVASEPEDGRYTMLRQKWGDKTPIMMFGFFQIQAAWAVLFALPMLAASMNPLPWITLLDILAVFVWIVAIVGEGTADQQLKSFREDSSNKGKVCQIGLWSWSRHPNYFFEWIHWFAYLAFAWGGPLWWFAAAGVVVMYLFLTKVTGIPMTEARSILSRGDAYRDYQRTTSAFFPRPPKAGSPHG